MKGEPDFLEGFDHVLHFLLLDELPLAKETIKCQNQRIKPPPKVRKSPDKPRIVVGDISQIL